MTCSQSLAIILTGQVCKEIVPDPHEMANDLADTASIIPALIPWSVACAVPLAVLDAPVVSIFAACYIYLLPLCHAFVAGHHREKIRAI